MSALSPQAPPALVKHHLADLLRAEIMKGGLLPGERIVEGRWASRFKVAQGSIREAINLLAMEGFVHKRSGRSARVVHFTENDILQLYQVRGALEGLAARLAAAARADTTALRSAVTGMRQASAAGNAENLIDCDLRFHLLLCEASGNPFVVDQARRLLHPFFAFVRMRVAASGQQASVWSQDLEPHQRIIDLIEEEQGDVAEQYVRRVMDRFAQTAYDHWERRATRAGEPRH